LLRLAALGKLKCCEKNSYFIYAEGNNDNPILGRMKSQEKGIISGESLNV
jgi:hypothetical protein